MKPMTEPLTADRYGRLAIALHWLIGAALLAQIGFGWALDAIAPRGTPARAGVINLHKSVGIALAVLILVRLGWRLTHRPPRWPSGLARWQRRAAALSHRGLYACMVVMPLSGYVASNFSRFGIKFFGVAWPAWGPDSPTLYALFNRVHIVTAWLFCALIALHVLAAFKHRLVDRDTVLSRMWPGAST